MREAVAHRTDLLAERVEAVVHKTGLLAEQLEAVAQKTGLLTERREVAPHQTDVLTERKDVKDWNRGAGSYSDRTVELGSEEGSQELFHVRKTVCVGNCRIQVNIPEPFLCSG